MARFRMSAFVSASVLAGALFGAASVMRLPAQAQLISPDEQLSVSMDLLPGETYEAFIARAEVEAARQIDNYFELTGADGVLLTLNGSNAGLLAPVLEVTISREQWTAFPQVDYWATYFTDSDVLLGLSEPAPQPNPAVADSDLEENDALASEDAPSSGSATITAPTSGGDSITPTSDEDEPVEPQTGITTPASEVAPFEPTPGAGTTDSGGEVDFEDSNDFEFVPEGGTEGLTTEDGAIQPQTGIDEATEGDVQVIQEPD